MKAIETLEERLDEWLIAIKAGAALDEQQELFDAVLEGEASVVTETMSYLDVCRRGSRG